MMRHISVIAFVVASQAEGLSTAFRKKVTFDPIVSSSPPQIKEPCTKQMVNLKPILKSRPSTQTRLCKSIEETDLSNGSFESTVWEYPDEVSDPGENSTTKIVFGPWAGKALKNSLHLTRKRLARSKSGSRRESDIKLDKTKSMLVQFQEAA